MKLPLKPLLSIYR